MTWRDRFVSLAAVLAGGAVVGGSALLTSGCLVREYIPPPDRTLDGHASHPSPAYDVFGDPVGADGRSLVTGRRYAPAELSPAAGAVAIDDGLLKLGRDAFYAETFGNEIPTTDLVGILAGPITAKSVSDAINALRGGGTTNLRVALATDAVVGGVRFHQGQIVDTGLDVPRGAIAPMGMTLRVAGPKVLTGITCAACHSTVDPGTHEVVHGAPNWDFNAGLTLALATNSAAFVAHTDVRDLQRYARDPARTVVTTDGRVLVVPDPAAVEDAVDRVLLTWPPGNFDSSTDFVVNPTSIPHAFTWQAHPYSWSGPFVAGRSTG